MGGYCCAWWPLLHGESNSCDAMGFLPALLAHPLTRGLDVDDPRTTYLRREIIRSKPFLRKLYREWYAEIIDRLPAEGLVLELGAGAGFLAEVSDRVIASEIFPTAGVHLVADGCGLPVRSASLAAIVMIDVFHHIPDAEVFLKEAERCVRPSGSLIMVEPWRTPWAEFVFKKFHHEPFDPNSGWAMAPGRPLSSANGALPWIVFQRDRERFEKDFNAWRIAAVMPMMPFAYLVSGGVSLRALAPGWAYNLVRTMEKTLDQNQWGMFSLIELKRR